MNDIPLSAPQRRRSLAAVIASMAANSLIYGLTTPLLALVLERHGVNETLIGLNTGVQAAAIFIVAPLAPRVIAMLGPARLMLWSIGVTLVVFLVLPMAVNLYLWFPLRFLIGGASTAMWVAGEAWVNQIAGEGSRGRVLGLYGTAMSAGFALGPLVLAQTGIEGFTPFLVSAALIALSGAPLLLATSVAPVISGRPSRRLAAYVRLAPTAMIANLAMAASSGISLAFIPIYGTRLGLAEDAAVYLVAASGLGAMAMQIPIGWLADRVDRRLLMAAIGGAAAVGAMMFPLVVGTVPWNWAFMFVFGGIRSGLYIVGLVLVGERFRGGDLAAATTVYTAMWGIGGIVGPSLGGFALTLWDPHGIPAALALIFLLFLPFPVTAYWRRQRPRA